MLSERKNIQVSLPKDSEVSTEEFQGLREVVETIDEQLTEKKLGTLLLS